MASQIRRAASSIPSNIAEGCGREGDPEWARFCIIARGSATELEYQLLLARDLKLIQPQDYEKLCVWTPRTQIAETYMLLPNRKRILPRGAAAKSGVELKRCSRPRCSRWRVLQRTLPSALRSGGRLP